MTLIVAVNDDRNICNKLLGLGGAICTLEQVERWELPHQRIESMPTTPLAVLCIDSSASLCSVYTHTSRLGRGGHNRYMLAVLGLAYQHMVICTCT